MIARSLAYGAGIFFLYNLGLWFVQLPPSSVVTQSQWQTNLIKVQDYPLAHAAKPGVVVGSSLAARLSPTDLDRDFYNLALVSEGPFTGLGVLQNHGAAPRVLLIETNLIMREESAAVLDNAFRPVISHLRPWLPALRERFQPANLIAGRLGRRFLRDSFRIVGRIVPAPVPTAPTSGGSDRAQLLFARGLADQQAATDQPLDPVLLDRNVQRLRARVDEFERRGTRCIFVEMPTDESLMNLRQPRQIRAALQRLFPDGQYLWIRPDQKRRYETTDGAHLTDREAAAYANRIQTEIAMADRPARPPATFSGTD